MSDRADTAKGLADDDPPERTGAMPEDAFPPRGIKPQIGERLQVRLQGGGSRDYVTARLIGYIPGRSVLVLAPETAEQRIGMAEGKILEVRMLTGGNIYVFRSLIQRMCVSPLHYLHLEWPDSVGMQALRKSPWVEMDLAAAVTVPGKAEEFVRIRNLSADGALLDVSADVGVAGDTLRLVCHVVVDGLRTTLTIDGVIQHVRPSPTAKGTLEYGVEFRDLREIEALWLRCLVYQRIAEGHLT